MSINKIMQCSGRKKEWKEQDSCSVAYLKLRTMLEKFVTIYSTFDEDLNLPSIFMLQLNSHA